VANSRGILPRFLLLLHEPFQRALDALEWLMEQEVGQERLQTRLMQSRHGLVVRQNEEIAQQANA